MNLGGVANTFQHIFMRGQPIFKGIAQTAQFVPGSPCPSGYGGASCALCAASTYASAGMASCASCPGVSVALTAGLASCACPANYTSSGTSGSTLVCTACPPDAQSAAGASTCVCTGAFATYVPSSNTCHTAPSSTP